MAADWSSFTYGGATFPLTTSSGNSLLLDADPALYYVSDFIQSILNTYLAPRLLQEAAKAPPVTQITTPPGVPVAGAVNMVVPYDPAPYLTENQHRFPLLAVYRVGDKTFEQKTQGWLHRIGEWKVQYILPPLNAGQMERIGPLLANVGPVIQHRLETMFDPNYQGGADIYNLATLEWIKLTKGKFGRWELGQNMAFPCWIGDLEVWERSGFAAGELSKLTGIDPAVDLNPGTSQPIVSDVADPAPINFVDPTTIPGLVSLWLPDNATLATDGQHVASIADSVSASNNTLTSGATQPVLVPGTFTDFTGAKKSVVRYDGSASYMAATVSALANDGSKTIVALARVANASARQSIVAQTLANDTGAHSMSIDANTASSAGGLFGLFAGASSFDTTYPTSAVGSWHVYSLQVTSTAAAVGITGSTTFQIDGGGSLPLTNKSGTGNWQGMSTANQIAIGAIPSIAGTFASADIGPVLVFNAALTQAQLNTAILYCRQWAGLL